MNEILRKIIVDYGYINFHALDNKGTCNYSIRDSYPRGGSIRTFFFLHGYVISEQLNFLLESLKMHEEANILTKLVDIMGNPKTPLKIPGMHGGHMLNFRESLAYQTITDKHLSEFCAEIKKVNISHLTRGRVTIKDSPIVKLHNFDTKAFKILKYLGNQSSVELMTNIYDKLVITSTEYPVFKFLVSECKSFENLDQFVPSSDGVCINDTYVMQAYLENEIDPYYEMDLTYKRFFDIMELLYTKRKVLLNRKCRKVLYEALEAVVEDAMHSKDLIPYSDVIEKIYNINHFQEFGGEFKTWLSA